MIKFKVGRVYRDVMNQLYEIVDIDSYNIFAKDKDCNVLKIILTFL